jgi:hypothetical protein
LVISVQVAKVLHIQSSAQPHYFQMPASVILTHGPEIVLPQVVTSCAWNARRRRLRQGQRARLTPR